MVSVSTDLFVSRLHYSPYGLVAKLVLKSEFLGRAEKMGSTPRANSTEQHGSCDPAKKMAPLVLGGLSLKICLLAL